MGWLADLKDFVQRFRQKRDAQKIEERSELARVAWVRSDDPRWRAAVGWDQSRLQRVVDPLADADKEHAEKQQQGLSILDGVEFDKQRRCRSCGAPYDEDLVPVIELEPGCKFVHASEHSTGPQPLPTHEAAGQEAA